MLFLLHQGALALWADRLRRSRALALGLTSALGLGTAAALAALWTHAPPPAPDLPASAGVHVPALRLSTGVDDVFLGWAEPQEWSSRERRAVPLPSQRRRLAWTPPETPSRSAEAPAVWSPTHARSRPSDVEPPAPGRWARPTAASPRTRVAHVTTAPIRSAAGTGGAEPTAHEPNDADPVAPGAPTTDTPAPTLADGGGAAPPPATPGRGPAERPAPAPAREARLPQLWLAAAPAPLGVPKAPQPAVLQRPAPAGPAPLTSRAPSAVPSGRGPVSDRGAADRTTSPTPAATPSATPPAPTGGADVQPPVDIALDRGPAPAAMNLLTGLFTASDDFLPLPTAPPANVEAGSPSTAMEAIALSPAPLRVVRPLGLMLIPEPTTGALLALGLAALRLGAPHARRRRAQHRT